MLVRNKAGYDLEVAGRVFPVGEPVEVGPAEAEWLASNPNFERVEPPADDTDKPRRGSKRED